MKMRNHRMVLASGLVVSLLGLAPSLTHAALPVDTSGPFILPFAGTVFNECTGEDVKVTGKLLVFVLRSTDKHISTHVFLKSYEAIGIITQHDHAVTQPPSATQTTAGGRSAEQTTHLTLSSVEQQFQNMIRCQLPHDGGIRIQLFFGPNGSLTDWSTSLDGTTCTSQKDPNSDPCEQPQ